ncbi:EF-hand domain-containing protein [Tsuneonella mangrovi]|uniref:EF-hand domain-containing protein n=1 Tax=Tsuneonella mangrovi TaxID=1982042 RepID=UPI000BA24B34|nr:EF-hand domain-containing protein [Tsuneonella mangrovi]
MNRLVLGAVLALVFAGIGLFWWQGRAAVEQGAPPPMVGPPIPDPSDLPTDIASDVHGPTPPEASGLTREQQRFFRYDRNRDLKITRNEMLSTRSDAFRKLDTNGDNLLTFEEWAHVTAERFDKADKNHDGELTQAEFATTATKPAKGKPTCKC